MVSVAAEDVQRKPVCYVRSGDTARVEKITLMRMLHTHMIAPAGTVGYLVLDRAVTWHTDTMQDYRSGQKILVVT